MLKSTNYKGVKIKRLADGRDHMMVNFKVNGKRYSQKNFSKIFGKWTPASAYKKLLWVKDEIRAERDPFATSKVTLDDWWYDLYERKIQAKKEGKEGWKEETTGKQYKNYYEKEVKNEIGWKKIHKITKTDFENILENISHTGGTYKNRLKSCLNHVFEEAIKKGELLNNPLDGIKKAQVAMREPVENRAVEDDLLIARELYKAIGEYVPQYHILRGELNMFLYLMLLSAHRYGELLKIEKEDCYPDHGFILTSKDTTKTEVEVRFPIPQELTEYINSIESGLLFPNVTYGSIYMIFQRLVRDSNITVLRNKKISPHDIRRFVVSILSDLKCDSLKIDHLILDHELEGSKKYYFKPNYRMKVEYYNMYWEAIRN